MKINVTGISGSRIAYYASREIENTGKTLIIVSSGQAAVRLRDDLSFFVNKPIHVMPEEEAIQILYEAKDMENTVRRIRGMQALACDEEAVVIAPVSAALRPVEGPARFMASMLELRMGMQIDPKVLREHLIMAGYEGAQVTESQGEFSVRGGIFDIFSPSLEDPIRIEFFDDEIDSIRTYDPETQRSLENLDKVMIAPAAEFMPTQEEREIALERILKEYDQKIRKLQKELGGENVQDGRIDRMEELKLRIKDMFQELTNLQIFSDYLAYFDEEPVYLWDYLQDGDGGVMVCDPSRLIEAIPEFETKEDFYQVYKKDAIIFTPFPERIKGVDKLDHVLNVTSRQVASFNGQMPLFGKELRSYASHGYHVILVMSTEERADRIREYLEDAGIHGWIDFATGTLSAGMVIDDDKTVYITESDIFPNIHKSNKRRKKRKKNSLDFSDLHAGDYVVHEEHGIGRFEGIKTLEADGEIKDYLKILYAGTDVLYIPTDQMDIVQRYIGNEGNAPHLSRLSGGDWRNARAKAKKAIEAIAEDLVKLYAEREMRGGYAFGKDTVWQNEFEEKFPYTETDDQLRAIEEIKADMEKPLPMDRLLCGDVGYGKTEVAARAIFKCLAEGKQAVLLAPTTLLANQHFHTLLQRFEDSFFNIEMLSRFVDDSKQRKVLDGLAKGTVDLVVGTHRLLSKDIKYKDLGLLVIDEEQRFGVKHKEQIKMMRQDVDVLTLSATPIPRTLSMSLTGIKNISTIEEPPGDRYPVQTFVAPEDDQLIIDVMQREFARGGQVYVLYNRVKGIHDVAKHIEELVPEARVGVGHGRMDESNLENVMVDFIEGETNVLVATTIIESGIDIPNANTIIILNSDKLGLAQLYQLRGRVGRSNRIAYAYLMYQPQKVLTEVARKRLTAIREFTEFGSGFKLAMRDLELRGAGNVLGEAQHGHIAGIGYELYVKEIDKAVRRLKGEIVPDVRTEIAIEADIPARIPKEYISDETLKLQAYKKIAQINSSEDAEDVMNELIDRYGDPPNVTIDLIRIAEVKAIAGPLGVEKISIRGNRLVVELAQENNLDAFTCVMIKSKFGDQLLISGGTVPDLSLSIGKARPAARLLDLMQAIDQARKEGMEHAAQQAADAEQNA